MRVVADSHALVWFGHGSRRLSARAKSTLDEALDGDGVVVSVVSLVELWYVSQTTKSVTVGELTALRQWFNSTPSIEICPVDQMVADAFTEIGRDVMRDPWDRFIVATARAIGVPLVTRDALIQNSGLVETIW